MSGYTADPATLDSVVSRLRRGRDGLEATEAPPPAPEAGECTAAIAAVLALLTDSVAGVAEGLDAVAEGVLGSAGLYGTGEESAADTFTAAGPV